MQTSPTAVCFCCAFISSRLRLEEKNKKKAKKLNRETKDEKKRPPKNGVRRHSGTRCLIVPLSVGRSRPLLSSLFVPRFSSVCVSVFGLVCIMARWRVFSIALFITTFFILATVNAERHHPDSITQLLKDPERLEIVHAMLKKYKG